MIKSTVGASFAATAALIAAGLAVSSAPAYAKKAEAKTVHCYGVNSCKGESDCKTAHNECKGQNSCKGEGFKALTQAQCSAAGGSLTEPK
ncbi:BufA2 family periplasmic bufferin-type metallophore [Sphingobium ummariense]|uniref:Uncharacterized protein n=1 Tax=Sphingobium ummariense RL-3 TaxID=1346791 RepID=T0KL49_9SPHN|nr:hypothetical protein [Sphingobium ummariense]EQB34103.1 hypothetical protein M529_00370 [Sphingobium ummariense RL-3]